MRRLTPRCPFLMALRIAGFHSHEGETADAIYPELANGLAVVRGALARSLARAGLSRKRQQ